MHQAISSNIKYGSANQKSTGGLGLYKAFMCDRRMFPISYGRPIGYLYLCDCIVVLIIHYSVQIRAPSAAKEILALSSTK